MKKNVFSLRQLARMLGKLSRPQPAALHKGVVGYNIFINNYLWRYERYWSKANSTTRALQRKGVHAQFRRAA